MITPLTHSIPNAAGALGISRSKLYEIIKAGELPVAKLGKRTLIRTSDLEALIERNLVG